MHALHQGVISTVRPGLAVPDELAECIVNSTLEVLDRQPVGEVMAMPPVFLQLMGVSEADWNDGGMEAFNEAVALVALGNSSLSMYVRSRLLVQPDGDSLEMFGTPSRKLLQEVSGVRDFSACHVSKCFVPSLVNALYVTSRA
jgi:hypothetical protein